MLAEKLVLNVPRSAFAHKSRTATWTPGLKPSASRLTFITCGGAKAGSGPAVEAPRWKKTTALAPLLSPAHLGLAADARVLDVGCGTSLLPVHLATMYTSVIGVDRDPLAFEMAAAWAGDYGDRLILMPGTFSQLDTLAADPGHPALDGVVLDLASSS